MELYEHTHDLEMIQTGCNLSQPMLFVAGGRVQTVLSMNHGLVRCLPATQWLLYTIVQPLSCWNAKHASTVSDTVYPHSKDTNRMHPFKLLNMA